MRTAHRGLAAILGLSAVLGGCAIPVAAPEAAFPEGFPSSIEEESFRPADRLLYAVTSFDGAEVTRWWVAFEALDSTDDTLHEVELVLEDAKGDPREKTTVTSVMEAIRVTLYDADRVEVDSEITDVARFVHEAGLFAFARGHLHRLERRKLGPAGPRMRPPQELRRLKWGSGIFGRLVDSFSDNDALRSVGKNLSVSPSVFELPRFIGGSVTIYSGLRRGKVVDQPIQGLPVHEKAVQCGLSVWRFKKPFLTMDITYVAPVGPLAMTAGAVAFDGKRHEDRTRRFIARLVGMSRDERFAANSAWPAPTSGCR